MLALGHVLQQRKWRQQVWITQHGDAFDSAALEVESLSFSRRSPLYQHVWRLATNTVIDRC